MKLGFVGLGKMGGNMVERLLRGGHEVVVFDKNQESVKNSESKGAAGSFSLNEMSKKLPGRKIIWMMVPSGIPVDETITSLLEILSQDDIIIDGGNSYWKETRQRGEKCAGKGIHYLDCGTSGGVWGLEEGYSLMYAGNKEASEFVAPIYKTLAPEGGLTYCGESGAGHFVKMVHNGIEYGMMQAYAEGFEILEKSPFHLDLKEIASGWRFGSVIRSWLLELALQAFQSDPKLESLKDYVVDSGEGRWTVQTAIELGVPVHIISGSLFNRFQSQQQESFAMKILAALRNEFGGHPVIKK